MMKLDPPVKPFATTTALRLLELHPDWYFFRIDPGTKKGGLPNDWNTTGNTNDPKGIERWPSNVNVGIALKKSGLIAVDVDVKPGKRGATTLGELELDHGIMPETYKVRSGSGGSHYYYLETDAAKHIQRQNVFGQDIDSPGYVLIAGCQFDGKLYRTITPVKKLAPAPAWFAEYLKPSDGPEVDQVPVVELDTRVNEQAAIDYLKNDAPPSIEGQNGDNTLLAVCGTLKDLGISQTQSVELIEEHYNVDGKCIPVWPSEDVARKVENAWAYLTQNAPGSRTAAADFPANDNDYQEAVASATKAAADLREKKQATWNSLKTDYVYVTQQEVFVSRTIVSSSGAPAMYSVRGFDRKFGYVKRELELGRTALTEYIFGRSPGTGLDFFESFCYMPGKPEDFNGDLNLWRKSGVEPKQGDVRWFVEHVEWLFGDDAVHALNWMAWVYRYQHLHPKHALLTHGEHQGTGKSVIANTMRRLLGSSNCSLLDQSALELDHDGWKVRTKLLIIEEVRPGFGSSNAVMKKLHPLVSEDTVHVDMKNRNDFDMPNVIAVLEGSNKPDALTMDDSDRRQLIVSTDRDGVILKPKPIDYYRAIYGKDGVGGYLNDADAMAAVAFDLLNRPLGDYSAQGPAPFTIAKGRMIAATGSALQKWMLDNMPDVRLVNINQIVKRIDADAPDIVRKHRGDIRADIEDVLRRKFNGHNIKRQIRPHGRNGGLLRVWAIGPDAATTATLAEGKLNAIYRADYPGLFKVAVSDFEDDADAA